MTEFCFVMKWYDNIIARYDNEVNDFSEKIKFFLRDYI